MKRKQKTRRNIKAGRIEAFKAKNEPTLVFDTYEAIRPDLLETFENEYRGRPTDVVIETDEFTAVCPWSGLPDFARITVRYVPDRAILELRSFKYYLLSYRTVGIFQEHLTRRLLDDLVQCCDPIRMTIETDYRIRGGLHTRASASYERKKRTRRTGR